MRRTLAEWASGNFAAGVGDLDSHVVFVVRPEFPESGVFHGPEGIRVYMRRFLAQWERYAIQVTDLKAVGDTVIADVLQKATGKTSGIQTEDSMFMLFTFRGESIVRMETVRGERDALEAAGLSE